MARNNNWFIVLTFVIAVLLTIFNLPAWLNWIRPNFVLLLLIYWVLALDGRVGVIIAWLMGIIVDIFGGTLLGTHALALTVVIYIVLKLQKQIRVYPLSQQAVAVFIASILYLALIYWIQATVGAAPKIILFWLPAITNTLLWPWLSMWLRKLHIQPKTI